MRCAQTPSANFSVSHNGLLVAYIYLNAGGSLKMAGAQKDDIICPISFADVACYQRQAVEKLKQIIFKATSIDELLFGLRLEGFKVSPGEFLPNAAMRRF